MKKFLIFLCVLISLFFGVTGIASTFGYTTTYNPEPATMRLVGVVLVGLVGIGRKKFFKKS